MSSHIRTPTPSLFDASIVAAYIPGIRMYGNLRFYCDQNPFISAYRCMELRFKGRKVPQLVCTQES